MMPALRLASLLVTERAMLVVFDHIANGFLVGETKNDLYIEKGPLEGTPLGLDYVRVIMLYTSSRIRIRFGKSLRSVTLAATDRIAVEDEPPTCQLLTTTADGQCLTRTIRNYRVLVTFRESFLAYPETAMSSDTPRESS
jgi:hypothetical protein